MCIKYDLRSYMKKHYTDYFTLKTHKYGYNDGKFDIINQ